jgi:hypothetical protein
MSRPSMSLYEIRREGWKALTERLGRPSLPFTIFTAFMSKV